MPFNAIKTKPSEDFVFWYEFIKWENFGKAFGFDNKPETIRNNQLKNTFPEADKTVTKLIKSYKKELKNILKENKKELQENTKNDYKFVPVLRGFQEGRVRKVWLEDQLKRLTPIEKYYLFIPNGKTVDVSEVKDIPISDYVEFNRAGFAKCLWHTEKTGSMKLYPQENKVKCFGCGEGGDIIDVIQIINGCEFKEALKFLSNK